MVDFNNNGIYKQEFDFDAAEKYLSLCVIGLPRSGTSFVSSALYNMGVFTGDKSIAPTYEDKLLKDLLDADDLEGFRSLALNYSKRHPKWAFKLPRATLKVKEIVPLLANPAVVCLVRDPLALQLRKRISQGDQNIFDGIGSSLDSYSKLFSDLSGLKCPLMLISYDKASQRPDLLIGELASIFHPKQEVDLSVILNRVKSDRLGYIENARYDKAWGLVEEIAGNKVKGWCLVRGPKMFKDLRVEVLNRAGHVVEVHPCDFVRDDLKEGAFIDSSGVNVEPLFVRRNRRKFNGRIGFSFDLKNDVGDIAMLRVEGERKAFFEF